MPLLLTALFPACANSLRHISLERNVLPMNFPRLLSMATQLEYARFSFPHEVENLAEINLPSLHTVVIDDSRMSSSMKWNAPRLRHLSLFIPMRSDQLAHLLTFPSHIESLDIRRPKIGEIQEVFQLSIYLHDEVEKSSILVPLGLDICGRVDSDHVRESPVPTSW
jgi:hypothetical protein